MTDQTLIDTLASLLLQNLRNDLYDFWLGMTERTSALLTHALQDENPAIANKSWFISKVAESRKLYVLCFSQIRAGEYYRAWCNLERIEIITGCLARNDFYSTIYYEVDKLGVQVREWQRLFPYKLFFSPAYLKKHVECSICGKRRDPWSDCVHELGKVYHGKECIGIVKQIELIEMSLVTDPVQKYSVLREIDENGKRIDPHNYTLVRFVADRLASPFHGWQMTWTWAYHPHELFRETGSEDACPCDLGPRLRFLLPSITGGAAPACKYRI